MNRDEHFSRFRPFCAALASKPSKQILDKLSTVVKNSEPQDLQALQEYILFPCQLYLRTPVMPQNYTIKVLNFVEQFFYRDHSVVVELNSTFLMIDLLQSVLQLTHRDSLNKTDFSEDLIIAICDCLSALVHSASSEVLLTIYCEEQKLAVSHLVFQALEWAQLGVKQVTLACLNIVNVLCPTVEQKDPTIRSAFVEQFCQMLPGVTTKLVKTLQMSDKTKCHVSIKIIVACIGVWRRYVTTIFNDKNMECKLVDILTEAASQKCQLLSDKTWLGRSQDHLLSHVQIFAQSYSTHSDIRVRDEIQRLCGDLVRDCSENSLVPLRPILIETLSLMTVDPDSNRIRRESKIHLRLLLSLVAGKQRTELDVENVEQQMSKLGTKNIEQTKEPIANEMIENENLLMPVAEQAQVSIFNLCERFSNPSKVFTDAFQLERDLSKLNGFLVLLKEVENSSLFFHSETYTGEMMEALANLGTFESESPFILSRITSPGEDILGSWEFIFEADPSATFQGSEKSFMHLTTPDLQRRYFSIVRFLSVYTSLDLLVDFLIRKIVCDEARTQPRSSYIFLLNELLKGLYFDSDTEVDSFNSPLLKDIFDRIVETYLNLNQDEQAVKSQKLQKSNDQKSSWNSLYCLITEGFGYVALAAKKLGLENHFCQNNLGFILVHILSQCDPHETVSTHVLQRTLQNLAQCSNNSGITSMLDGHCEMLCRSLSLLFRKFLTNKNEAKNRSRPRGLCLLLNVVLKLQQIRSKTESSISESKEFRPQPELKHIILVLLDQLDISWMDPDKSVTQEILNIISMFVKSIASYGNQSDLLCSKSNQSHELDVGVLTTLIKDLQKSDGLLLDSDIQETDEETCPPEGFHKKAEADQDDPMDDDDPKEPKPISDQVKFLEKSIEHCRHFISMVGCPQWQITALEIVSTAVQIIRADKEILLPLVHQSWQPLKLLFESDNIFVVSKAFKALHIFASSAKDFIHRRTLTDVFPSIVKYLQKLKAMVSDRRFHQTMISRQSRHLLTEMTIGLWDFMALLELNEVEVDPIIDNAIDFVTFAQKNPKMFDKPVNLDPVRILDSDILWLKSKTPETVLNFE